MKKLAQYRAVIVDALSTEADTLSGVGAIETLVVVDTVSDNYLLIDVGWDRTGRVHAPILHIRLPGDNVQIEFDGTEEGIAYQLIADGILLEDLVLAFRSADAHADPALTLTREIALLEAVEEGIRVEDVGDIVDHSVIVEDIRARQRLRNLARADSKLDERDVSDVS
ncbi:MAG: XisI protein [Blastochloris sp.]|nr:XisI protein [Blastochloris sp.]